ncbi:MAG TPA: hypothetical protein VM325_17895 [Alphaproteobacteria bacterium]|nr:hypothetical protein [Alphaproteobacteria bacterium]
MGKIAFIVIAFASATLLAGCNSVEGVDEYQGALHLGCRPLPGGGVICAGDRG